MALFAHLFDFNFLPDSISVFLLGFFQLLFLIGLFRIKRLRKGMPFLQERGAGDMVTFLGISLLLAISFFAISKEPNLYFAIPLFFAFLIGFIIIFWWRGTITKKYLEKVKAQELEELQQALNAKNQENEQLRQQNGDLSKIIHKDNKLIPALDYAVRQYLLTAETETDYAVRLSKAKSLLAQVEAASQERQGILTDFETGNKKLPSTNVPSVDSLLSYMYQKAKEQGVTLDVSVSGNIHFLIQQQAAEHDFNTLLSDLIENAVVAARRCTTKNVMVHMGISNGHFSIDIFDSGMPFAAETLSGIGYQQTTTHADEGGSGIGLVTTFEILKKYQASFVIEDLNGNSQYTKKVSVCFDQLCQFRFLTK
ncbi:sensor histidine kinase [Oscillospiraceae bacterium CM]|nr:sensor histidine kinase [Oscillospiraceae bacterium CM]